jgi:hypothetical protein
VKNILSLLCFLATGVSAAAGQSFTLSVTPAAAQIYGFDKVGNRVLLGTGNAKIKLEKDRTNRFIIQAPGFAPVDTVFARGGKYGKTVPLAMATRLVNVTMLPFDAEFLVNGDAQPPGPVPVPPGKPVTVEVRKRGYKTERRVYSNEPGSELPLTERIELRDKSVNVQPSIPRKTDVESKPASVYVDGNLVGNGNVDVVVPFDKCVSVTVSAPGYKPETPPAFCNNAQLPLNYRVVLLDRMVTVTTVPPTASISVDGNVVGRGSFDVVVRNDQCANVKATLVGYGDEERQFCNNENARIPDAVRIELRVDEAYTSSIQSDQANVNFTIEVGPGKTPDGAWRTISQVILSHFDVLEITDKETGYMRTAWEATKFSNSIVRTRVIVKLGDTSPLKYVVKVATERAPLRRLGRAEETTVKDDQEFREWDRLLNTYKDIINELQARLR